MFGWVFQRLLKLGSDSCLDRCDSQIPELPALRAENLYVLISGRPDIGISRAEQQNAICAGGCGEMRDSAVVPDKDGAFKHRGQMRQRQVFNKPDTTIFPLALQLLGLCFIRLARNDDE